MFWVHENTSKHQLSELNPVTTQVAKETEVSKFIQAAYVYFGCDFAVHEHLPSRTLKPNYFLLVVVG